MKEVTCSYRLSGGWGARRNKDGFLTHFPANVTGPSIEDFENLAAGKFVVLRDQPVTDTGGAGKFRGGLAEEVVILNVSERAQVDVSMCARQSRFPALGRDGRRPGTVTSTYINKKTIAD